MDLPIDRYLAIVLGVIGIIEGLALTKLAEAVSDCAARGGWGLLEAFPNLLLSFLIILRVFQGYVAAGLKPIVNVDYQVQILIAFALGIGQYCMTDAIGRSPYGLQVYVSAAIIAFTGFLSHGINLIGMKKGATDHAFYNGVDVSYRFQIVSIVILLSSSLALASRCYFRHRGPAVVISLTVCSMLAANIGASYILRKQEDRPVEGDET